MNPLRILRGELPGTDPADSVTLPKEAYLDAGFLELEKRELFYKTWLGWRCEESRRLPHSQTH